MYLSKIKNERFKMTINTNASMKDKFNDSLGALKPLASMFYEVVWSIYSLFYYGLETSESFSAWFSSK